VDASAALHLRRISPTPPPTLAHISPISRPYLAHISPISRPYLAHLGRLRRGLVALGLLALLEQVLTTGEIGEIQGRYRGDTGEV
jgi:hypothetical protein